MDATPNKETPSGRALRRRASALLAAIVFAFAYFQANAGLRWGENWHPDELPVSRWTKQVAKQGYISDRVYPGGWFVLADAKARLDGFLERTAERWDRHGVQDGPVSAAEPETRPPAASKPPQRSRIQAGRDFNALLFAATALLLFLLARELGVRPAAAAAAALLFACLPAPLEHAHYCETDGIVGFSLALAAWPALRAIRLGSARWALAAAFAAGFALSCKYSLGPLLLGPPALAWELARHRQSRRGRTFALLALGGLLAFAAGFLAGTPTLRMDPAFFLSDATRLSDQTWAENVGQPSGLAGAIRRTLLLVSSHGLGANGAFTLALFAVGAACWAARDLRRYWPVVPLFLVAYIPNVAFVLPWVRNQESLPVLPGLCLGAALALDRALRAIRVRGRAAAAAAAVLALAAAAFVQAGARGNRILSCFQARDTRAECREWLAGSATENVRIALDRYVAQTIRGTPCKGEHRPGLADSWPDWAQEPDIESGRTRYALRNASFSGRRVRTESDAAREASFLADCPLLRAWTLAPGAVRTLVFSQPDVELRVLPDPAGGADVPVALDRPLLFAPGLRPFYDAAGAAVGPVRAVHVAGQRHTVHPAADGRRRWAVALALDGPPRGSIVWNGLFRPRRLALSAGGAAVFELDAGAMRRAAHRSVRPSARVRLRDGDDQATRCVAFLTDDPAEVARALRRAGEPDAALRFLRSAGELPAAARVEAFLAARAAGEPADPTWEEAAREALAAADVRVGSVGGVPLAALRDFAGLAVDAEALGADRRPPVFLPAGTWEILFRAAGDPPDKSFFEGQTGPAEEELGADGLVRLAATVRMDRPGFLRLVPDVERLLELHIRWDVGEQLDRVLDELRTALGEPAAAR